MLDGKALGTQVVALVKDYVERSIAGLSGSVTALTTRLAALEARPAPKDGEPGLPGKDADPARLDALEAATSEIKAAVAELAAREMPKPQDGKPGKDADPVTPEQIASAVAEHLKANPPKDGESIKGDEGRGIQTLLFDAEGNLVATLTDGTVKTIPMPKPAIVKDATLDEHRQRLDAHAENLDRVMSDVAALKQHPAAEPPDLAVPDDVAELVAKAAAILAEPPPPINRSAQPLVVNMNSAPVPPRVARKTMTLRQNDNGEVVADIQEVA